MYSSDLYSCLFVCLIITHEPMADLSQILILELDRTTGMFLALL